MPAVGVEGDDAITGLSLTFMPTGTVTYSYELTRYLWVCQCGAHNHTVQPGCGVVT